jgi:hypothetical protein
MKKIIFRNGRELEISQGDANTLTNQIVKGCDKFQCFSDDDNLVYLINLEDVSFIK